MKESDRQFVETVKKFRDKTNKYLYTQKAYEDLLDQIKAQQVTIKVKDKEINELKKKRTVGQINEAYAKTIEDNKEIISKQSMTINKLQQKELGK